MNEEIINIEEENLYAKKRWKKKVNKLAWALFWFQFVVQFGSILVAIPFSSLSEMLNLSSELTNWLMTDTLIYLIGFPVFFMIIRSMPDYEIKNTKHFMKPKDFILALILCLGILYGFNLIGAGLSALITHFTGGTANPLETMIGNPFYTILFGCLVPGIMEELIFRKMIISKIYPMGDAFCILVSGILFGFFHGNLAQITYAIPMGCFLAYIYIRTNDIRNPMILHILSNLVGTLLLPTIIQFNEVVALVIMAIIIILAIVHFYKQKNNFVVSTGELTIPQKEKNMVLFTSKGFIAYSILTLLLVILMLFISTTTIQ